MSLRFTAIMLALVWQLILAFLTWPMLGPAHGGRPTGLDDRDAGQTQSRLAQEENQPVRRQLIQGDPFENLMPSSYRCTNEKDPRTNICVFSNVVRWNNMLYYLTAQPGGAKLPRVMVSQKCALFDPNGPLNQKCNGSEEWATDVFLFASVEEFKQMARAKVAKHEHFRYSLFWRPEDKFNWWHTFDDAVMYYFAWCQGLGLCEFSQEVLDQSVVLVSDPNDSYGTMLVEWDVRNGPGFKQLFECYGSRLINVKFPKSTQYTEWESDRAVDTLFTIDELVMGTGTTTGHSYQVAIDRALVAPPTPEERLQMMKYIRQCAGLPAMPEPVHRAQPNVVLLNRAYGAGRSLLRLDEVQFRVSRARPQANVSIVFLEGMDFKTQASFFANADILLVPHGAAAANFLFLPLLSGVVHVSANYPEEMFQLQILADLPASHYRVINLPYTMNVPYKAGRENKLKLEPIFDVIERSLQYNLRPTAEARLDWIARREVDMPMERHLAKQDNFLMAIDEVVPKLLSAIDQWQDAMSGQQAAAASK